MDTGYNTTKAKFAMKKVYLLSGILMTALVILIFCSMTSFVFPIHNWVDQNCFLTVGREMLNGRVPYRDLFEQKGPLLYLFHALAAGIDRDGFFGVFLLQLPVWFAYLYLLYRIAQLRLTPWRSFAAMSICGVLTAVTYCYSLGDNAEELALPAIAFGLFTLLSASKSRRRIFYSETFVNGILAGALLMIKFTLLGFYAGWVLISVIYCVKRKEGGRIPLHAIFFLAGILLVSIPFLIYFIYHKALDDFFSVYFHSNIFLYSSDASVSGRILFVITSLGTAVIKNPVLMALIFLGQAAAVLRFRKERGFEAFIVTAGFWIMFLFLYIGGTSYRYYLLATAPFALFGILPLCGRLRESRTVFSVMTAGLLACTVLCSNCRHYYGMDRMDYPQFRFAEQIEEDSMLLNYNFLDGGFYLAAKAQLPPTKYFCRVNIERSRFPEMYQGQEALIEASVPDFVVARISTGAYKKAVKSIDFHPLEDNYTLIDTFEDAYNEHIFYLYKRK